MKISNPLHSSRRKIYRYSRKSSIITKKNFTKKSQGGHEKKDIYKCPFLDNPSEKKKKKMKKSF